MIEWAITSSVLILVVLVLRRLLVGRISLRLQYGLWALVLVRLLLPVNLGGTSISILNTVEPVQMPNLVVGDPGSDTPRWPAVEPDPSPTVGEQQEHGQQDRDQWQAEMDTAGTEADTPIALGTVLLGIWAVGAVSMGLWLLWVNVHFARKLRCSRVPLMVEHCPRPVYMTGATQTPCLFGLFHPCIYVTEEVAANETVLRHSLAHELTHFRHGDHIWAALRGLCLALHWYNPLVWLAASISQRDGELCCDEATVKTLGEGERAAYGRTLLAVTCQGRTNPMLTATSMTGSGSGIKERILLLAKRPKTAVYTLVAVALISAVAVGCTFTGAQKGDGESTGASTGADEFVPDKVAMVQLLSSAWPPDPVTDPDTVTHLWDLYQGFTFEGTVNDLTQNNLWSVSVTFSAEGTNQEESFTIYQGGLCTMGEDNETIYRLKNGDELYQEFYTVFQLQMDRSTDVDEPDAEVTLTGLAVEASGSEEEIGRQWAETFAAQYRSLSPQNPLYSTDSAVLECTPYARSLLSQPREQIYLMRFACQAVDKAGFEQWYTGAAGPLTGEEYPQYEGWMEFGWFIVLEEQQKDQWVCVNAGTGGYGNWGYLNYETGEIWEQILEEQLSADIDQADPEMVLCILPFVDWSRLDGNELNQLWELLDRACLTQGRVYGPEEDRMWSDVYPDDQVYRDLYVMLAALNTDGAYAEGMEGLMEKQQAYDPQVFEFCLQNLTAEQQEIIRMLAGM
jgi:beta-lactamase regulating signal transducer with metallopeptidase domain